MKKPKHQTKQSIQAELMACYELMHAMTLEDCTNHCRRPHSCCTSFACEVTALYAREKWGIELTPQPMLPLAEGQRYLPFMGENGCVVAPHLRPFCTLHHCDINTVGHKMPDNKRNRRWTKRYFQLRERINFLENLREHAPDEADANPMEVLQTEPAQPVETAPPVEEKPKSGFRFGQKKENHDEASD